MSSSLFLEAYDSIDVIGNGSFGIIRKVRRKSDGIIFARKELNFERMSERDRKQIVAEVNILKDLHHDHIVRYHDRYVDRDAGILYIVMEYCGGGDLSTVIKQAAKHNRAIPEDTIWNYFYQILQALHHCHHPNNHQRSASGSGSPPVDYEGNNSSRRAQILHRDLKPDNVFLDDHHTVKLGDFGLSKALAQASFANTYVGTPYYMSPELMQEKAYDSKSDIWSLGCLIYELCALKPPFHEAKSHSELSIFIRNGRIPPLPRGYSQALTSVIKSMLNLNPAMRPSAAQLLQHERIETIHKVAEAARMFEIVKSHRTAIANREREVANREQSLQEKEHQFMAIIDQKDKEIESLKQVIEEHQKSRTYMAQDVELAVKRAVLRREDELRVLIMQREEEVAASMTKREEEIMEAVQKRDAEICEAWAKRESEVRKEVEENYKSLQERVDWAAKREIELKDEEDRLLEMREKLEEGLKKSQENTTKGRKDKNPLEEVKNLLHPQSRVVDATPVQRRHKMDRQIAPVPTPTQSATLETPITRSANAQGAVLSSAMKGVVLTATGESLATPAPTELSKLFDASPKVGLNFARIFDFDEGERHIDNYQHEPDLERSPPPSPTSRKERERMKEREKEDSETLTLPTPTNSAKQTTFPPTRIRRPSIRASTRSHSVSIPTSVSSPGTLHSNVPTSSQVPPAKPLPHPHLRPSTSNSNLAAVARVTIHIPQPPPEYDLSDEENLPSPFIKRTDQTKPASINTAGSGTKGKRGSGLLLRAVAAANNANRRSTVQSDHPSDATRPSLTSARKASEEARKALSRP